MCDALWLNAYTDQVCASSKLNVVDVNVLAVSSVGFVLNFYSYQKTNTAFKSFGSFATRKLGDIR